jgi:outer membrane protein assembly factor BamB
VFQEEKTMQRRNTWVGALVLGIGLVFVGPAQAYVTRLTPLGEVLADKDLLCFVAKVEKLDPEKLRAVLTVTNDLQGKAPFRRLPVNLTGDQAAQKDNHVPQLLKRLAPDLPLIVFVTPRGKQYTAFAYTNGTWFQMIGRAGNNAAGATWAFTHCEPYLRRTFKGTTEELRRVVIDGLSGKKKPPEPDPKEPPGLGPELKPARPREQDKEKGNVRAPGGPLFAVIPWVGGGLIAVLATLFPAVFGGLAIWFRRWLALLTVASLISTLYMLHAWFGGYVKDYWWGTQLALWLFLAAVALVGAVWSWRRHRAACQAGQAQDMLPRCSDEIMLGGLSLLGLLIALLTFWQGVLLESPWKELLLIWVVAWAGSLYLLYLRLAAAGRAEGRPARPAEGIMLWALVFACAGLGATAVPRAPTEGVAVVWTFEPRERGSFASSPLVAGERVYIAAEHRAGFSAFGTLYCLDRATGKELWHFDNDQEMKPVFSSPCLAGGRLFVGEGFHQDEQCKLYCLDAATGKKVWDFATTSHTESSPCVADGKVYFGAGDDGIFCLDAGTGREVWHFKGLHVDTSPAVAGNRLYAGNGYGEAYEIFCLNAADGKRVWRRRTELPVWGSPVVDGGQVFFGIGNGNMLESAPRPEGVLLCVEAETGKDVWPPIKVGDGVLARPAVTEGHVYFGARDQHCYCVDRRTGKVAWKHDVGSPVVASPALVADGKKSRTLLYVLGSAGHVCCLDASTGEEVWRQELAKLYTGLKSQLLSSPTVLAEKGSEGERRRLYFGAGLSNVTSSAATLICLEDQ